MTSAALQLTIDLDDPAIAETTAPAPTARRLNTATPAQTKLIAKLVEERKLDSHAALLLAESRQAWRVGLFSLGRAHRLIEVLMGQPVKVVAPAPMALWSPITGNAATTVVIPGESVPEGRYAVEVEGELRFYHVDRPTEGRWTGYIFVKVQAGDDLHAIRSLTRRTQILNLIAADIEGACLRYGRELGTCGRCGRTLTVKASRDRGIGPDCASKGW